MFNYIANKFSEEQHECIKGIKKIYKEDNQYMADAGVVTSWFTCCVNIYDDDDEYSFRKMSEFAIDDHTVLSKIWVDGDDEYNSVKVEPFIMYTRSKVDKLDDTWMDFHDIKPIGFKALTTSDAIEWQMKRDIWDELDWHKQNSFLGMEVMEEDRSLMEFMNH